MVNFNEIKNSISIELEDVELFIKKSIQSDVSNVMDIHAYLSMQNGKRMRPALLLLSAKVFVENASERTIRSAALLELLHMATLLHDDVIDHASTRRGIASVNSKWSNQIAVLMGDFLFAKCLQIAVEGNDMFVLEQMIKPIAKMSEGEIWQMQSSKDINFSEESYYDVIRKKTAELITAACVVGSSISGASETEVSAMKNFGMNLGMAFQIKDDILDLSAHAETGKNFANDLREKKMTLPVIHFAKNASAAQHLLFENVFKKEEVLEEDIIRLAEAIQQSGAIEYAESKMLVFQNAAENALRPLPEGNARQMLSNLLFFVTGRNH